jgi:putative FmdB family regulatory protein
LNLPVKLDWVTKERPTRALLYYVHLRYNFKVRKFLIEVFRVPVYEYNCDCCGSQFEIRQSFNDAPVAFCPRCNAKARRVFRASPVIYKGDGFYVTENRPKESDSEAKPVAKPAAKTEAKPAAAEGKPSSGTKN